MFLSRVQRTGTDSFYCSTPVSSRCCLFSLHTREAALYAFSYLSFLVFGSQTSCFFLHFFLFSTSMDPRMTGTAILPEGGGVRGIRSDVSRWTLAPSSGSLSQLLFSFSSVCSCSPTVSSLFVHE